MTGRALIAGLALTGLVAACGTTAAPSSAPPTASPPGATRTSSPGPALTPVPTGPQAAVADVAVVTCTSAAPTIAAPVVRPQPDGVHFRVVGGLGRFLSVTNDDGADGRMVDTNDQLIVLPIAPSDVFVGCDFEDAGQPSAPLSIVDPLHVYRPIGVMATQGSCGDMSIDYAPDARGERGDPVAIVRRLLRGLAPLDVVETAGYRSPDARMVRVVRAGTVVATISAVGDGAGGWLIASATLCGGVTLGL